LGLSFILNINIFYTDNFDDLASHFDQVIAVDWLGMGCSSRVSTRITRLSLLPSLLLGQAHEDRAKQIAEQVATEFIESLDEVRQQEGLTEFVLAGHSLGGYLSGKYALRYPEHLEGLVLISPAGVPEHPLKERRVEIEDLDWKIRLLHSLWHLNVTPQSLIRIAGKNRGPEWIESAIKRRFSGVSSATLTRWQEEELKLLSDYLYHITAAPGNGEYALNALLQPIFVKKTELNDPPQGRNRRNTKEPLPEDVPVIQARRTGVYARVPLEKDIEEKLSALEKKVPIYMIFGDHDWLYYPGAANTVRDWTAKGVPSELEIIKDAGHHLYLENAKDLNESIIEWTKKNVIGYDK
jgi:cardiolipin-specific phospholipase